MAITVSIKNIPEVGDVVKEVVNDPKDPFNAVDVYFESGKHIVFHRTPAECEKE